MAKPDPKPQPIGTAWFEVPQEKIPRAISSYALGMELYTYGRRVKNSVMYRLVTGEDPPVTLGMWMSRKAATAASGYGGNYTKPYSNIIANGCSVLENRIGTVVPFVMVQPNDVSFEVRSACTDATFMLDGVFEQNNFAAMSRVGFRDKFTWGQRIVLVESDAKRKKVAYRRILPDEVIVDEIACATGMPPSNVVVRRYMARSDAFAEWGGQGGEEGKKIDQAIRTAPAAFINQYLTSVSNDFICVLQGWSLPDPEGKPGIDCLCLSNIHLRPVKKWTRPRFPFAIERWTPQMLGYFSPGGAYTMSPYQMQVNNLTEQINACIRAVAYPRWLTMKGSSVTAQKLGGRPGAVHEWTGQAPTPIVPVAANAELYEERDKWENKGYASVGLTQQQVQGQKQPGVNAGVALRMMVNIEDSRNKSLLLDAEAFTADVAELTLDVAEEIGLVIGSGEGIAREIKYADLKEYRDKFKVRVFPISSLPATPEGKAQQIADWYADGTIDKRAYFRLQSLPDLTTFQRLVTSSDDLIEDTLDRIVREGRFYSPEPTYDSLPTALKMAQARYNLEKRYQSPRKVLRALQQFMAATSDMISNPNGQTMTPTEAPGLTAPAAAPALGPPGAIPAPPPLQIAPAQGAPVQLAA